MRLIGRVLLAVLAIVVAIWALKLVAGLVVGTVLFALRLAIFGALVAGAVWTYRRLTARGRRRRPAALSRGGSTDWQYIRGKIDRDTYLRRKS